MRGNRSCRLCRRLAVVRGECGDVDQPGNTVIGSCGCDDGSAVRVADEDGRAADRPERAGYCGDIAFECVQAVLGGHHLVPLRLKRGDHLVKARPSAHRPWANTMLVWSASPAFRLRLFLSSAEFERTWEEQNMWP